MRVRGYRTTSKKTGIELQKTRQHAAKLREKQERHKAERSAEAAARHDIELLSQANPTELRFLTAAGFEEALEKLRQEQRHGILQKALHLRQDQDLFKSQSLEELNKLLKLNTEYLNSKNLAEICEHVAKLKTQRSTNFVAEAFLDLLTILENFISEDDNYTKLNNKALAALTMLIGSIPVGSTALASEELTISTLTPELLTKRLDPSQPEVLADILLGFVSSKYLLEARDEFQNLGQRALKLANEAIPTPRLIKACSKFIDQYPEYIPRCDTESIIKRSANIEELDSKIYLRQLDLHGNNKHPELDKAILDQPNLDFYQSRLGILNNYLKLILALLTKNKDQSLTNRYLEKLASILTDFNKNNNPITEDMKIMALQMLQSLSIINYLSAKLRLNIQLSIPSKLIDASKKAIEVNIHSQTECIVSNIVRESLQENHVYPKIYNPSAKESVERFGGFTPDRIVLFQDRKVGLEIDGAAHWNRKTIPDSLRDEFLEEHAKLPIIRISVQGKQDTKLKESIKQQLEQQGLLKLLGV